MDNLTKIEPKKSLILVVDDIRQNLILLNSILRQEGYEVSLAMSGKETLEILDSLTPNLILLDIMMPEMNGLEVCRMIKSKPNLVDIPIMFLTASQEEGDLISAFELGGLDYINKPFRKSELIARIKTQLKITQQAQQLIEMNNFLTKQQEELQYLNKELSIYNDILGHDLKNPLTVIKGYTYILENRYADKLDQEGLKFLQNINLFADRMSDIVTNMSVLSQIKNHQINVEEINISLMIKGIIYELEEENCKHNHQVIIAPEIFVNGDAGLLRIALQNLLSNAWKFTSKNTKNKPEIEFGYLTDKSTEKIYFIRDNGVGFDMKNSQKIFDFFTRLHSKDEFEGTGIGLGIVKRIIDFHKGQIWCKSELNKGSTFFFTLNL